LIIAQISDFHVDLRVQTRAGIVDTRERLRQAVAHVKALQPAPDVVLATGDLVNDGSPQQYGIVAHALSALPMPYYVIPGNHDNRDNLRHAFADQRYLVETGEFLHYVVDDYPLRLIGLDTLVPGRDEGELCEQRLAWLQTRLAEAPRRPTLIFMHHPPFATGLPLFDSIGLRGAPRLREIITQHPQIEAVICGHVHRSIHTRWGGTVACTASSISFQYPMDLVGSGAIEALDETPAGRLYVWQQHTGLLAHTFAISEAGS
jgi:3',5'-cyclic-AMP phosphodiesterase